tara:strand:+ start:86 stop:271 length:186 start_codon:yes stop_codon:yes gene_type:complete
MPHSFPGAHDPMIADIIKTLFLIIVVDYLENRKIPGVYTLFLTLISIVLYWALIKKIAPGS